MRRSSSTAVTSAPAASRAPVRMPGPGPISRMRRPGVTCAASTIASSTSPSARKFCESRRSARRPCSRSSGPGRPGQGGARRAGRRPPPGPPSAGQPQRRARVEVPPGAHTGRAPAGSRRPRSSPRCPCTGPAAGSRPGCPAPPPGPGRARPARRWRRRPRPARWSPPGPAAPRASSWWRARRRRRPGRPRRSRPRAPRAARTPSSAVPPAASVTARRTAVLRPLKLKSKPSPSQARGKRRSRRTASAAARWMAGPPGYGRPSRRPTLSNASPAASSTVCPSSR